MKLYPSSSERAVLHPLAWGVMVPLALALLTPLLVQSAFIFPFISTKTFAFRILVEIALAGYAILSVKAPAYRPRFTPIMKAMGAYLLVVIIASLFGENPYKSFWGNIERGEGILTLAHVFVYAFLCAHVVRTRRTWEWFFAGSLLVAVAVSLYALGQYFGVAWVLHSGDKRLSGTIGNAAFLAGYLLIHTFIALWFALTPRARWQRALSGAVWIFLLFITFNTGTRGALLAALIVYVGLAAWYARQATGSAGRWLKTAALAVGALLVVSAVVVWLQRDTGWVRGNATLTRLVTISFDDITTQSRLLTWESSMKGWKDRPLLGYGYENYNVAFNKYFNPLIYRDAGSQIWFDRAHNVVFDVLVTSGILGMIAYMGLYGLVVAAAWRAARRDDPFARVSGGVMLGLIVAHVLQNFFVFDILATYIPSMLVFGFLDAHTRNFDISIFRNVEMKRGSGIVLAVLPVLALALFFFNINPARVNSAGLEAMRLRFAERYGDAYHAFLALEARGTYQLPEIRTKFAELGLEARGKRGVTDEQAEEIIQDAIDSMLANIEKNPKDAQYYLYLMNLYFVGGRFDVTRYALIEKAGAEALRLSPTRPQIYYLLGQGASARGENAKAIEYFEKAAALNPAVADSQWNLAVAYRLAGKKAEEREAYERLDGMGVSIDAREDLDDTTLLRLTQRFISTQEYARLATVFEELVERNSGNAEYWGNLAAAYKSAGEYVLARQAAEKVQELNPRAQTEIEQFLKELESDEAQSAERGNDQ